MIDKAEGPTSHDVVRAVRKALRTREVGHAGTLDPMATGLLVVAVGEATKLVPYLTAEDKVYETELTLGSATDTLDRLGEVTETREIPADWRDRLEEALDRERTRHEQIPPVFSAIHVDGERAHERARRGETVVLAARPVRVKELRVLSAEDNVIRLRVEASKGYYVRSLGRDLAESLGTVGHLRALRRVRAGALSVEDAVDVISSELGKKLIPTAAIAARVLPSRTLNADDVLRARRGQKLIVDCTEEQHEAWLDERGNLVAVGRVAAREGSVARGFVPRR